MIEKIIKHIRENLSTQILISMVLGVITGLFFGQMIAWIGVIGDAFIRLFQMPVIPYIMVSLLGSLGRLSSKEAKAIFLQGGAFLGLFWLIILLIVILFPLGFPNWKSASFFSKSLLQESGQMDIVGLFIPFNPFDAMANAIIPSVVMFSVALGLALISLQNKQTTLEVLATLEKSLMRITETVAKLTPIGVFAILASASGTLPLEAFGRLQVYIILQALLSLMLSFWLLPALVAALTPLKYKEILLAYRTPLLTAFATANLLIVLPLIIDRSKQLLKPFAEANPEKQREMTSPIEIFVPASFTLPDMGRLISLSFIPFAAWFGGSSLSFEQYPTFLAAGLASFFGGDGVTIMRFLLTLMRLPTDMLQLYITLDQISVSRFGTLLAGMNAIALALLGTASINRLIRIRRRQIIRFSLITSLMLLIIVGGVHSFFTFFVTNTYSKDKILENLPLLRVRNSQEVEVFLGLTTPLEIDETKSRIIQIKERKVLRACYYNNDYPMAYLNRQNELVGFDIEMAHIFAKDLGLKLELVPLEIKSIQLDRSAYLIDQGYCDIIMGAIAMTPERALNISFSLSVLKYTLSFLVHDYRQEKFKSWADLQNISQLRLGIPGRVPYYEAKLKGLIPQAELVETGDIRGLLNGKLEGLDGLVGAAESNSAWTLLYPNYSVAIPKPIVAVPVAYILPYDDQPFLDVFNTWLQLKKEDGTITSLYDYWIQGKTGAVEPPRWSIIRNVLNWAK
ncbi:MAG TPA: Na+:H+ dicarboxylate symporter [Cyanothece sp. UBA12306]|nr:Na+:H+ dicarboxylate symporter [Cyanothece sp. UBA12306]